VLAAVLENLRYTVRAYVFQPAPAANAATATIPIVFMGGPDPVVSGLVASIDRPGGNITGVSIFAAELLGKRIGLLRELVPRLSVLGTLIDSNVPVAPDSLEQLKQVREAAGRVGVSVEFVQVKGTEDFDSAFASLSRKGASAIIVAPSILFNGNPSALTALAARYGIPTAYELREFVVAGGLLSYAPRLTDAFRQGGVYTGRILKGDKPADLPVLLPTRFEFVLNLKTAKALSLDVPSGILAIADEVIE
jgi:putative ABC transport system substrate-binding protein